MSLISQGNVFFHVLSPKKFRMMRRRGRIHTGDMFFCSIEAIPRRFALSTVDTYQSIYYRTCYLMSMVFVIFWGGLSFCGFLYG